MTEFRYLQDGTNGRGIVINIDQIESVRPSAPDGSVIQFAGSEHVIQLPDSSVLNTMKQLGMVVPS